MVQILQLKIRQQAAGQPSFLCLPDFFNDTFLYLTPALSLRPPPTPKLVSPFLISQTRMCRPSQLLSSRPLGKSLGGRHQGGGNTIRRCVEMQRQFSNSMDGDPTRVHSKVKLCFDAFQTTESRGGREAEALKSSLLLFPHWV